jgi:hypothetical protein
MQMVTHHRIGQAVNTEDPGQKLQPLPEPETAVFVRLAGKGIVTAEEGPPHAPLDGVDNLHLPRINGLPPRLSCHGMHLQSRTAYLTKSPNILSHPDRKA